MAADRLERQRQVSLGRRVGPSEQARKRMADANDGASDWRATCQLCSRQLSGTLKMIREHGCE